MDDEGTDHSSEHNIGRDVGKRREPAFEERLAGLHREAQDEARERHAQEAPSLGCDPQEYADRSETEDVDGPVARREHTLGAGG